jgi:uncharacterized membrane protein
MKYIILGLGIILLVGFIIVAIKSIVEIMEAQSKQDSDKQN